MAKKKRASVKCSKTKFSDGVSYCIWFPMSDDEDCGVCLDIPEENVDDVINILKEYKKKKPRVFKQDPKDEEFERKLEEKTSKWWYKLWSKYLENVSITVNFFDWRFSTFLASRPVVHKNQRMFRHCSGIAVGPFIINWG